MLPTGRRVSGQAADDNHLFTPSAPMSTSVVMTATFVFLMLVSLSCTSAAPLSTCFPFFFYGNDTHDRIRQSVIHKTPDNCGLTRPTVLRAARAGSAAIQIFSASTLVGAMTSLSELSSSTIWCAAIRNRARHAKLSGARTSVLCRASVDWHCIPAALWQA